ncbi:dihydroorotate dehydrogenase [Thermosipho melanesiensis]|uniref:2-polyprenylphenol hydroxylase and related flavodoxin oxidoreductase-like protein n=2 Tax=Thermosipho melanesiensis TaxID=46541 RepID=A6LJN9_THEM4|nr:dihydroorotate dehydrogenase [Thermosipho melanesiensis]ABR30140.1 2-polyprenylphenol hydroxylase and related flavodoxin oxidoreductase-like protein [Thermosipho melanesiensis BI429]APT73337.1 dihydroorotate dehydrogenase [Thermosipho melanesiensis]OOC38725.1 dihydroorotate dehydrogenase [Thermosipho melanesiensis]OOC40530.1 dihydroorotate dehydrogenase [Thermosipho melanesiensis]OOC40794.1 dihydroorotate dehydrogenase [Thermosipho melanesiensis]
MENTYLTKKETLKINEDTYLITLENINFEIGQFLMIETNKLVRKPFILGTWDGKTAISVQIKGKGTKHIVETTQTLKAHFPLGNPFIPPKGKGIVIISPTCLTLANLMTEKYNCDVLVGSKTPLKIKIPFDYAIGDEYFAQKIDNLNTYDWYLISGSKSMEEFVLSKIDSPNVFVSLEEYMGCGIGACKSCAIFTKNGVKHVCTDGPIFRRDML